MILRRDEAGVSLYAAETACVGAGAAGAGAGVTAALATLAALKKLNE